MNKVSQWFMRAFLWTSGSKLVEIKRIRFPDGKNREVVIFSNPKTKMLGQVPAISRVITLNEILFQRYTQTTQKYVLAHEAAHANMNVIARVLVVGWILLLALALLAVIGSTALLFALSVLDSRFWPGAILLTLLIPVGVVLALSTSWAVEFHADYNAIKTIGSKKARLAWVELRKKRRGFLWAVRRLLTHPPLPLTLWVYERLGRVQKTHRE